jgi:signal transduction histidine kinase
MVTARNNNCGSGRRKDKMDKRKNHLKTSRTILLMYSIVFFCAAVTMVSTAYVYKTTSNFRAAQISLMIFCVAFAIITAGFFNFFIRRGRHRMLQLAASEQQLRATNQHLRANEKEREKFLKMLTVKNNELQSIVFIASHDLRSPLVNIKGFAGELEKSCDELTKVLANEEISMPSKGKIEFMLKEDIPESLNFIKAGADKMDLLISGLLRLSRIGTITLDIDRLNMSKMIKDILKTVRFDIQNRNVKVDIGDMPTCLGDSSLVNQVFSNLIDNALKYMHHDREAQIQISGQSNNGHSIYCVQDNGIGISDDHMEKIFEIFHRLAPKETDGEGLGLTIVKRILGRQDGRVWAESEYGKGSRFYVSLPAG